MKLRLVLACAAALLTAACVTPAPQIPGVAKPLDAEPEHLRIFAPASGGLHAAVLLVPGCDAPLLSARAALMKRDAEKLGAEGFVAAILNYRFASQPECIEWARPEAIAAEVAEGLAVLKARKDVDPHQLHVVGWSWGGRGVLELLMNAQRVPGLVSAAAFYPVCPEEMPWKTEVTLFLLLGEKDAARSSEACMKWANKSDGPGPIAIHRYRDVGHGFDVDEAGDPQFDAYRAAGTQLTFDASNAYQAWIDLVRFLKLGLPPA